MSPTRRLTVLGVVSGLLALACTMGDASAAHAATARRATKTVKTVKTTKAPATKAPTTTVVPTTPFTKISSPYGANLAKFAQDLDAFWAVQMPAIYKTPYRALKGYYAYDRNTPPPDCGTTMTYEDIAGNAFYCRSADYIAFDNQGLFADLYDGYGEIALGMVLAHEIGHAIQARTNTRLPSVYSELQADCFAGAWLRWVSDGRSKLFLLGPGVLGDAISATLAFRDRPGVGANSPGAHGNGFDRTGAVQLGYDEGTTRCAAFRTNPPPVTATSFTAAQEAASGGDVSLEEAVRLTIESANRHFASVPGFVPITAVERTDLRSVDALLTSCSGAVSVLEKRVAVCPDAGSGTPLLRVSENALIDAQSNVGDVGSSMVLVLAWTARVQQLQGEPTRDASNSAELRSTCLAGTWLGAAQRGDLSTDTNPLSLSPGDVDEGLITLIKAGGKAPIFDVIRSLRAGFLSTTGLSACTKF